MIYTIKTDDTIQFTGLNQFLSKHVGIKYSVINDAPQKSTFVLNIEDFRKHIEESRKSVKKGIFLTGEELEKESSKN